MADEKKMDDSKKIPEEAAPSAPVGGGERPRIEIDDSETLARYANFCRVTGTPEELIVDLALNTQQYGTTSEPIEANQRVVMNYYTGKRLMHALSLAVQRHEQAFGVLETDVRKRVIGQKT